MSPRLAGLAIFYGLLEYRLERKQFTVEYLLERGSPLRRWLRRPWMAVFLSALLALPLGTVLAVFTALSRPEDWLFLAAGTVLAPLLFLRVLAFPGGHLRAGTAMGGTGLGIREVVSARLAGWFLVVLLAGAYVYLSYTVIKGPGDTIYPGYHELTVQAFQARVRSVCPVVEAGLGIAAAVEGLSWHYMTAAATEPSIPGEVGLLLWFVFFLNISVALAAFVRGTEGCILLAWRWHEDAGRE